MGNFMKAYTIAFESSGGGQVTSRAIVPFLKNSRSCGRFP